MSDTRPVDRLVIALAQINSTVGDIDGNLARIREARAKAHGFGADLVMFSELFISGYPPEDLVLKPSFQDACRVACENLARETADGGPAILVGLPWGELGACYNAYALLAHGRIEAMRFKVDLPNYGVFDEKRVFRAGPLQGPIIFKGVRIGIPICEDIWGPDPVECIAETGGEILLVPNGSPYWESKSSERLSVVKARISETHLPLIYLNQLGGQDELVFDGATFALNADGTLACQLPAFEAIIAKTVWERRGDTFVCVEAPKTQVIEGDDADYTACMLGLRDYVEKIGFPGVVLGLSGGVDSALCAALAVDALGREKVHAVMLPYRYTSQESLIDAKACATALGLRYDIVPIAPAVEGFETLLAPMFAGTAPGLTEENLQSRTRGTVLMSISNKFGSMLVTTGNKSEMSVGYATIYGDMNGGFNPIKDIYKTQVFRLCHLRNRWKPKGALGPDGEVIPYNIIVKPPSAELRENQKDQDSLPPYDILDGILEGLVEKDQGVADLVAAGYEEPTIRRVERLLYLAEYKRRQSAPGVKVTRRNFGRDRRYPIVNGFRDR
ncbi:NAD+ synthase [Beijerinckia indica]|uniref:Glutamine-dependent NAD(+) synthetase n=1 Tax=Beijerinckia indica subsp. indica (strain ATCC 9039 / DSM 1715 / NCIMB 8712) TaxID=395963 RepID=B2IGY9_BEII9|nr:NAD+ synthase [Beijerinckia indica]ACB94403.1 NAD+ synthetase [Beijerinckia indica subsp. indica ATCC 9039]